MYFKETNRTYHKYPSDIALNGGKVKAFPLLSRIRQGDLSSCIPFFYSKTQKKLRKKEKLCKLERSAIFSVFYDMILHMKQ